MFDLSLGYNYSISVICPYIHIHTHITYFHTCIIKYIANWWAFIILILHTPIHTHTFMHAHTIIVMTCHPHIHTFFTHKNRYDMRTWYTHRNRYDIWSWDFTHFAYTNTNTHTRIGMTCDPGLHTFCTHTNTRIDMTWDPHIHIFCTHKHTQTVGMTFDPGILMRIGMTCDPGIHTFWPLSVHRSYAALRFTLCDLQEDTGLLK